MPTRKLTEQQVAKLRRRAADGESARSLADEAGLPYATVKAAINGTSWGRLINPAPVAAPRGGGAKLTEEDVADMRRQAEEGESIVDLAAEYGVSRRTVEAALFGHSWAAVTDPPPLPQPEPVSTTGNAVLTEDAVAAIRRRYTDGESLTQLAAAYRVAPSTIGNAVHGVTWRHVTDPPPVPVQEMGGSCTVTEEEERLMVKYRRDGMTLAQVGALVGYSKGTVQRVCVRMADL